MAIKTLGYVLKITVGRVSGKTAGFFFGFFCLKGIIDGQVI
jgi:hypothetical protein